MDALRSEMPSEVRYVDLQSQIEPIVPSYECA